MTRHQTLLHLTRDHPPLAKGGLSLAVSWLCEVGSRCGHLSIVLSFDDWRPRSGSASSRYPVERTPLPCGGRLLRVRDAHGLQEALRDLQSEPLDWVHVHHGTLWEFAASLGGRKMIFVHVLQAELNRVRGVAKTWSAEAQSAALRCADLVVVSNAEVEAELKLHHPALKTPVTIAGVDSGVLTAKELPRVPRRVLVVGRLDVSKGSADALEVCRILLDKGSIERAVFIGGVPGNQRAERRWRGRFEQIEGLHCTGWLPSHDLLAELDQGGVLLSMSHAETLGLGVLEAMARGVPVVGTACAGHRALLGEHERGLLVPVRGVREAVEACESVWLDMNATRRRSQRALRWVAAQRLTYEAAWGDLWRDA